MRISPTAAQTLRPATRRLWTAPRRSGCATMRGNVYDRTGQYLLIDGARAGHFDDGMPSWAWAPAHFAAVRGPLTVLGQRTTFMLVPGLLAPEQRSKTAGAERQLPA